MIKTVALIEALTEVENKLANRREEQVAIDLIRAAKTQLEARRRLGEDPKMAKLPAMHAAVQSAVDAVNARTITIPSIDDLSALVAASESAEA